MNKKVDEEPKTARGDMKMISRGRTRTAIAGAALACLLALGACSDGDENKGTRTTTTTGTVTEVIGGEYWTRTNEGSESYRFVVSFEDEDSVGHVAQASNLESTQRWSEGDAVLVRYDVRDPEGSCTIEYVKPKTDDTQDDGTNADNAGGEDSAPDDNPISQLVHEKTDPTGSKQ